MAVISYKCQNCEGELVFDPNTQNYKCEYCGNFLTKEELQELQPDQSKERIEKIPQDTAELDGAEPEGAGQEAVIYSCPSCNAEIVTDSTTAATFCYYCHNPVVLSGRVEGEYMPNKIIPFSVDRKQAEKKFLEYVHSKKFIPRAFFRKQQIEKLSGVYFPYWVYQCSMEGRMEAQGTNVRVWRSGETEYTETKYYRVEREGKVELENITKNALKKANQKLVSGVLPYNMNGVKEFAMGYLSGFLAEKRDVNKEDMKQEVDQEVQGYGRQMLRDTISGYSSVNIKSQSLRVREESWAYVMLPVWTLTYKGKNGKLYYYSMNGQTGKVFGELPVDYKKVGGTGGIIALVVLVLFLIGGYLI